MTTLLITDMDIKKNSIVGGNVDTDKIYPAIKTAQQLFIKPLLGRDFYNEICDLYENDDLTGDFEELYEDYIKPMVIHSSSEVYLTSGAYMVTNNGIVKHKSDDSETISKEEVDYLVQASRRLYESYKKEFISYMKGKNDIFTNYKNCSSKYINVGGWHL